jgi:hypothetical protein
MPIKLVSLSRRPQTFNLVCEATRVRRDTFEYDPKTGQRHTRRGYIRMPGSVTLAAKGRPGHRSKLLPDAAADEDEIKGAERAKMIRIIRVAASETPAEAKAEAAAEAKAESRAARTTRKARQRQQNAEAKATATTDNPTETKGRDA